MDAYIDVIEREFWIRISCLCVRERSDLKLRKRKEESKVSDDCEDEMECRQYSHTNNEMETE